MGEKKDGFEKDKDKCGGVRVMKRWVGKGERQMYQGMPGKTDG